MSVQQAVLPWRPLETGQRKEKSFGYSTKNQAPQKVRAQAAVD